MQPLNLKAHVGADGMLHLDVPMPMSNTDINVTLSWQTMKSSRDHDIKQRLKAKFAKIPKGINLADELIAERRAEANRNAESENRT